MDRSDWELECQLSRASFHQLIGLFIFVLALILDFRVFRLRVFAAVRADSYCRRDWRARS